MLQVESVKQGSLAQELGLEPGSQLLSVNGRELEDFLDWEYLTSDEYFTLVLRTPGGEVVDLEISRNEGVPLGVGLAPPDVIECGNRCDFCFVKGNPKGLRRALYVRDDDYRLSFRYGNFVTLTNLREKDIDRIVEYGLSPLYVSVHASDPAVRRRLLGNPSAPDVIEQIRFFGDEGIECHTQIVLQPGLNDGPELERTLRDLYSLNDAVLSVSVVPVGLTNRNRTASVRMPSSEECRDAIAILERLATESAHARGKYWVYGSDELYLRAEVQLPHGDRYDDFEQLENGVGVVRYFQKQVEGLNAELPEITIGVVTGTVMESLFPDILATLEENTAASFELIVQTNDLFGPSVTTAGLLPGRAFAAALEGRDDLDLALLPAEALNDDGLFMDDMSFGELSDRCEVEIKASHYIVDALGDSGL